LTNRKHSPPLLISILLNSLKLRCDLDQFSCAFLHFFHKKIEILCNIKVSLSFILYKLLITYYQVTKGGEPGGAFCTMSISGITYPNATTIIIKAIHKLQRSVHFGVTLACFPPSAIGNSVSPSGARTLSEIQYIQSWRYLL